MKKRSIIPISMIIVFSLTACGGPKKTYEKAQNLVQEGKYEEALKKFNEVSIYEDAQKYIKYCNAFIAIDEGNYTDAIKTFESLEDFKSSQDYKVYYSAYALELSGRYDDLVSAKELFESIPLFSDCKDRIIACETAIDDMYNNGISQIETGNYEAGYTILGKMDGYSDSLEQILNSLCDRAQMEFDQKQYESGYEILHTANIYTNDESILNVVENKYAEGQFAEGSDMVDAGQYEDALRFFETNLKGYSGVDDKIAECKKIVNQMAYDDALSLRGESEPINGVTIEMLFDSTGQLRYGVTYKDGVFIDNAGELVNGCSISEKGTIMDAYANQYDPVTGKLVDSEIAIEQEPTGADTFDNYVDTADYMEKIAREKLGLVYQDEILFKAEE